MQGLDDLDEQGHVGKGEAAQLGRLKDTGAEQPGAVRAPTPLMLQHAKGHRVTASHGQVTSTHGQHHQVHKPVIAPRFDTHATSSPVTTEATGPHVVSPAVSPIAALVQPVAAPEILPAVSPLVVPVLSSVVVPQEVADAPAQHAAVASGIFAMVR